MADLPNKVTKEDLERLVAQSKTTFTNPAGTLTHCVITLPCGYTVTGESACVDPANYDKELGEKYALEQAVEKLWPLEGYLLANDIYRAKQPTSYASRMIFEQSDLREKLDKLCDFLSKPQPSFIDDKEWALLLDQRDYMSEYFNILEIRIKIALSKQDEPQLTQDAPHVVDSIKFDGENHDAVMEFMDGHSGAEGESFLMGDDIYISSSEGMHTGKVGDYVVKFSDGRIQFGGSNIVHPEPVSDGVATLASNGSLCDCADLPKNIFQQEFIPSEHDDSDIKFDFGIAIRKLKEGKRVMRAGWNGKGMFVYYVPAASYPVERNNLETMGGQFPDDMVPYREYLALKTAQGDVATWAPSVSDALATDWCLA